LAEVRTGVEQEAAVGRRRDLVPARNPFQALKRAVAERIEALMKADE